MLTITLGIIILTAVISFTAFSNQKITNDLIFDPPAISERNQWYRFITCAFIHADISHLLFNMLSLYLFGDIVEKAFGAIFFDKAPFMYVGMYLIAQFVCLIPTYLQHQHNHLYRSLGASGAVSAVVFAGILIYPTIKIGLFILPPIIPGFIFGPLYLLISAYMSRRGGDHINHSAHIWGALAGVLFLIIASYTMSGFDPVGNFVGQVKNFFS